MIEVTIIVKELPKNFMKDIMEKREVEICGVVNKLVCIDFSEKQDDEMIHISSVKGSKAPVST